MDLRYIHILCLDIKCYRLLKPCAGFTRNRITTPVDMCLATLLFSFNFCKILLTVHEPFYKYAAWIFKLPEEEDSLAMKQSDELSTMHWSLLNFKTKFTLSTKAHLWVGSLESGSNSLQYGLESGIVNPVLGKVQVEPIRRRFR